MLALSQAALIVGFSALQGSQMEGSRRLDLGPGGGGKSPGSNEKNCFFKVLQGEGLL